MGSWYNQNAIWDILCAAQGADVAPGSQLNMAYGVLPFSGTTGGHPAYGWRHLHEIFGNADPQQVIRAIFANDFARRIAYGGPGSEFRYPGYYFGMRPFGWSPESNGDNADGSVRYYYNGSPIDYYGYDYQHNWTYLDEVVKTGTNYQVPLGLGPGFPTTIAAGPLAAARLQVMSDSVGGQVNAPYELNWQDKLKLNNGSDRAWARPIDILIQCARAGDATSFGINAGLNYIKAAIQFYKNAPGCGNYDRNRWAGDIPEDSPPVPKGSVYFIPTQYSWATCVLFELNEFLKSINASAYADVIADLDSILPRMARWCVETYMGCPGGITPWVVSFNSAVVTGVNGAPVDSLLGAGLDPAVNFHYAGFDTTDWMYRSMHVAKVYGIPGANVKAANAFNKFKNNVDSYKWLIDEKRRYVVPAAAALAKEDFAPASF